MARNNVPYQPQTTNVQGNRTRVYINPNFNKNPTTSLACSTNMYMHVNPRFQYCMLNPTQSASNPNKIYVNPNFLTSELKPPNDNKLKSNVNNVTYSCPNILQSVNETVIDQSKILVKSRYCLVRNNEKKPAENNSLNRPTNTIKVSKYKSVAINTIKKNISDVKNRSNVSSHTVIQIRPQKPLSTLKMYSKGAKSVISLDKRKISVVYKKNKSERQRLKKNNIPCPLFKKFGKCIRDAKGFCEFLHDKKHVNICRRFLKGICHNKNCLLSHELTIKKMPTCYFYLNGVCAKENCPYLHVKINENTKICPEFLKGYCEKGQHCTYQHTNSNQTNIKNKNRSLKKHKFPQNMKVELLKLRHLKSSLENTMSKHLKTDETVEYRYYKDDQNENSIEIETIKPSRCKLGVLPTFIQL